MIYLDKKEITIDELKELINTCDKVIELIDIDEHNEYLLEDIDGAADELSDYLSDAYGYCHFGFSATCE